MRNHRDGSTGDRVPSSTPASAPGGSDNAFTPEYLDLLNRRDEPPTASDADAAGPWHLEQTPDGRWAVLRVGESLARGDAPSGEFLTQQAAQLAAGFYPGTGKSKRYRLGKHAEDRGYPVYYDGELAGYLPVFDEDLIASMNTGDALISAPYDLAWLFDAVGGVALERTGKLSLARARGEGGGVV
jgi:hypothetical protein